MRHFGLALLPLFLLSCQQTPQPVAAASKTAADPLTVAVQYPKRRALGTKSTLTGEFRPWQQVDLFPRVSGYLRRIHVDVGSQVRAGELMAQLDAPELQAELDQAHSNLKRAESDLTRAQADVTRFDAGVTLARASSDRLHGVNRAEAGLVAQQEIDTAVARLRDAEAQASAARAQVTAAAQQVDAARAAEVRTRSMLDYTRITAPFAGTIVKRFADPGALVPAGAVPNSQPLVRLADFNRLRLAANVPEALTSLIHIGETVNVRIPALHTTVSARLARFTGNVQQTSRTTEVELDIPNPGHKILPGMVADILLNIEGKADALTIPIQAFSNLGGNRYVLVANASGQLEERQIKTGLEGATDVEVLEGLGDKDQIVTSNRALLRPGMKVETKLEGAAQ